MIKTAPNELAICRRRAEIGLPSDAKTAAKGSSCNYGNEPPRSDLRSMPVRELADCTCSWTRLKSLVELTRWPKPHGTPTGQDLGAPLARISLSKNALFTPPGRPAGDTGPLPITGGVSQSETLPPVFPALGCTSRRRSDDVSHIARAWAHLPAGVGDRPRKHRRCRETSGSILRRPRLRWVAGSTYGARMASPGSIRGYRARSAVSFNVVMQLPRTIAASASALAQVPAADYHVGLAATTLHIARHRPWFAHDDCRGDLLQ